MSADCPYLYLHVRPSQNWFLCIKGAESDSLLSPEPTFFNAYVPPSENQGLWTKRNGRCTWLFSSKWLRGLSRNWICSWTGSHRRPRIADFENGFDQSPSLFSQWHAQKGSGDENGVSWKSVYIFGMALESRMTFDFRVIAHSITIDHFRSFFVERRSIRCHSL